MDHIGQEKTQTLYVGGEQVKIRAGQKIPEQEIKSKQDQEIK